MRHVYQHAGAHWKVLLAGGLLQQQLVMLHRYQLDSHSHTGIGESRHDLLQQQIVLLQLWDISRTMITLHVSVRYRNGPSKEKKKQKEED